MQDRKLGLIGGIVRAAQLHPLRTVEHCTIVLLVLHLVSGRACQGRGAGPLCAAGQQQCCCAADTPGPLSVLTAAGVTPAPQPTMSMADLQPGKTVEHHDFRGDIYRFPLSDGIILNLMRTTAGTMRSGDLHNCTQFDVILAGRARLVTYDTVLKREVSVVYGRNDFIKIPARVPHLFEFLEDNYMVEWWDCDFRAWYYQPYRDRISRAFEAAKAKDAASQTAAAAAGTADQQASKPQKTADSSAAKSADQLKTGSAGEQSRVEAARRQRGRMDESETVDGAKQQQQQQAQQSGADGAAGQPAGDVMAQQATGDDLDAEAAAGAEVARGKPERERSSGDPQGGDGADARLGDPVARDADKHTAANSAVDVAGTARQGADSSAAARATLPADAAAEADRKRARQQHSHASSADDARVGQMLDGSTDAAAKLQRGASNTAWQVELHEDIDSEELAVDQED